MSRIARVVLTGLPYHITQRGNAKQQVFFTSADYQLYLDLAMKHARASGLRVLAYCLMPNHVHWVAVPDRRLSLAKCMGLTHADFARHFNLQRRSCGHVWQSRFYSCPLERAHLWRAIAYVERNPVRAGLVATAADYPWSSAPARLANHDPKGQLDLRPWKQEYTSPQWSQILATSLDEEAWGRRIAEASLRGRPLGSDEFVEDLEARSGRRLRPLPAGRPRKDAKVSDSALKQMAFEMGK